MRRSLPGASPAADTLVPALLRWFATHARDLPWRRTRDPYAIWVSEIMLQQTQVKTVIPYWERWLRELPTIASLAAEPPERIHKLWEGLGYYTRVRNMQKAAQQIVTQQDGRFPNHFDAVLALPGIGRYTAGAICSIAFNQSTPILDGNVIRVLTRLFGIHGDPRDQRVNESLWQHATALVNKAAAVPHSAFPIPYSTGPCSALNQSLMELGALVCTPRQPACDACPLREPCLARRHGLTSTLPNLAPRPKPTPRRFIALVVERSGRFLVRQRPANTVNGHLWEFPNYEATGAQPASAQGFKKHFDLTVREPRPFCVIKHSITRYRITVEVFRATQTRSNHAAAGRWLTLAELAELPFTSAHGKILRRLATAPPFPS